MPEYVFGRPTKYTEEYCQLLIDHMAEGLSFEAFAGKVSTTKKTLYNWCESYPDFLHAKEIGTEKCRIFWEELGRDHVVSRTIPGVESTALNTGVYVFNMKNRFPEEWKDKKEVDNTHEFKNRPDWLDAAQ
jgi:hypothetical protein